ncbi:40S ribosomal protein S5-1 [Hordeum vulgare]|nr:40S ribosomal protein S5-1 [Hordeum vulgare]
MLHFRDVEGPKKTGSTETRLEAMEQQVFKCQGMVERGLNANHMMITEFTSNHKMDAIDIGKHLSKLYDRVDQLQGQIYDMQNQNCGRRGLAGEDGVEKKKKKKNKRMIGFDFRTSKESTGNADGPGLPNYVKPRIQEPFGNRGDYDNSMSNMAASEGLCNDRMGMPDESFEDPGPGDTCNGQASRADNSHEDIQTDASGQRIGALVAQITSLDKLQSHGMGRKGARTGAECVQEPQDTLVVEESPEVPPKRQHSGDAILFMKENMKMSFDDSLNRATSYAKVDSSI